MTLQRVVASFALIVVLLLAGGLLAPRFARVELSTVVDAPASVVFAQANDPRRLERWAPLAGRGIEASIDYSGPARGVGATAAWSGAAGDGGLAVIAESVPFEYVAYLINPDEPGEAVSWLALEPTANGTRVTQGFEHDYGYNPVGRYFGLLWTGIIRRDMTQSLEALETLVESLPRTDFAGLEVEFTTTTARAIAYIPLETGTDAASASKALGEAYFEILAFLDSDPGLAEDGPPIAILRGFAGVRRRLDAAIPVTGERRTSGPVGRIRLATINPQSVVRARHLGAYDSLIATHRKVVSYLAAYGIEQAGAPREIYVSDPGRTAAAERVTEIVYPVRVLTDTG